MVLQTLLIVGKESSCLSVFQPLYSLRYILIGFPNVYNPLPPLLPPIELPAFFSFSLPDSRTNFPSHRSHTSEPRPTLRKSLGPTTLSHPRRISRRPVSLEISPAQCSMVCRLVRPSIGAHLACPGLHSRMVTVLFLQCLAMSFNSVNRARRGIKWGLVTYTFAAFLPVMIRTAATLDL